MKNNQAWRNLLEKEELIIVLSKSRLSQKIYAEVEINYVENIFNEFKQTNIRVNVVMVDA